MKKVYRVLCEVDSGWTIDSYNTYVFAYNENEATKIAEQYWRNKGYDFSASIVEVELIYDSEVKVIGVERVY